MAIGVYPQIKSNPRLGDELMTNDLSSNISNGFIIERTIDGPYITSMYHRPQSRANNIKCPYLSKNAPLATPR